MRIAWLTPVQADGAIASYSRHVVGALRELADVELWAPTRSGTSLSSYDVIVHNIGDHYGNHGQIHAISRRRPGVVILHARALVNLFHALHDRELDGPASFLERIGELYGAEVAGIAADYLSGASSWSQSEGHLRFPFTEDVLAGQYGAVVHSTVHAQDVQRRWAGPVLAHPFPTYPEWLDPPPQPQAPARRPLTLVTSGFVNPNKHVDAVISVLAGDRALAARVRYLVVGSLEDSAYSRQLAAAIAAAGLAGAVKLLGSQPQRTFARILGQADVHINLRFPSIEGGSASAAEQLASGKPLVVYDTGSFAELPEGAAVKVAPNDIGSLREALWMLAVDPARRAEIGARGRQVALSRTLESYSESLVDFLSAVPRWPWKDLRRELDAELAELGIGAEMAGAGRIGRALAEILPAHSSPATRALLD